MKLTRANGTLGASLGCFQGLWGLMFSQWGCNNPGLKKNLYLTNQCMNPAASVVVVVVCGDQLTCSCCCSRGSCPGTVSGRGRAPWPAGRGQRRCRCSCAASGSRRSAARRTAGTAGEVPSEGATAKNVLLRTGHSVFYLSGEMLNDVLSINCASNASCSNRSITASKVGLAS